MVEDLEKYLIKINKKIPDKNLSLMDLEKIVDCYKNRTNKEEKVKLCSDIGIDDIKLMYTIAYQLGLTKKNDELNDREFEQYINGNKVMSFLMKKQYEIKAKEFMYNKEDPETINWTKEDDNYLINHFGEVSISEMVLERHHSETAILYYARHLTRPEKTSNGEILNNIAPLRKASSGFSLKKVLIWLNIEIDDLVKEEITIKEMPKTPKIKTLKWVESNELYHFIMKYKEELLNNGADKFFIKEIIETYNKEPEACYFLDHTHTCQNGWAGPCFELYCDGKDPECNVKYLKL